MVFDVPLPKWVQKSLDIGFEDYWPRHVSFWIPRHFEIARIAHIFKRVAALRGVELKVLEPAAGNGFVSYLLALEGISVHSFDVKKKTLERSRPFQELFDSIKTKRGLDNDLTFTTGLLKDIAKYEKHKLLLSVWPPPASADDVLEKDSRKDWMRIKPEAIVVCVEAGCAQSITPVCMSDRRYRYNFLTGWRSTSSGRIDLRLGAGHWSDLTLVEAYTKEKLDIRFSKRSNKVEPYPWERILDKASKGKPLTPHLYTRYKRPVSH